MARCKFNFPPHVVGGGVCEAGCSRLYFDVVLNGIGYKQLTLRIFPPKDFTWSQLTSAKCSNEWIRNPLIRNSVKTTITG